MKNQRYGHRKNFFTYIKTTVFTLFVCLLFVRGYTPFVSTGDNIFHVKLNGQDVGSLASSDRAEELLIEARRKIASESDELVFIEAELQVTGAEILWGNADNEKDVLDRMEKVLRESVIETMHCSYTVKVNDYIVSLASLEEATGLLQAAIDKYDTEGRFSVSLVNDTEREFSVLATRVVEKEAVVEPEKADYSMGGIASVFANLGQKTDIDGELDFDDYEQGISEIQAMNFAERVEVVEVYMPETWLTSYEAAVNEIVTEQETAGIYEVVKGDTLSEIAIKVNIPMDKLIEMNDSLKDENTKLQIGQQLIITVPEPTLSITRMEQSYVAESYDAEVEIIDVDTWYTTQTEVLQQPSAGFRKAIINTYYVNDEVVSREVVKEEVIKEAVPKIMRRGTKIPPKYIKPLKGGRVTSTFGPRKRPTAGASTNHKGVDWATATGTAVLASNGGTVTKAGWGNGYGYVIYIDHSDGRQTRYAHLSKILVSVGQKVKQGDRIALSGNTGVSTGPHVHFEILINGKQVNPLDYVPR